MKKEFNYEEFITDVFGYIKEKYGFEHCDFDNVEENGIEYDVYFFNNEMQIYIPPMGLSRGKVEEML